MIARSEKRRCRALRAAGRGAAIARLGVAGAACLLAGAPARAILSSSDNTINGTFVTVNSDVGADRFYNAGYWGSNAIVANIEAGHVWDGHETLSLVQSYVNDPSIDGATRQYDYHATAVGFTIAGLGPEAPGGGFYYYQLGIAPGARLVSGAIASQWVGNTGEFEAPAGPFAYAYKKIMQEGVTVDLYPQFPGFITETRPADVVNSSWGYEDNAGTDQMTLTLDALAHKNRQTVTLAAGNHDVGDPQVVGPASGYNSIAVAALESAATNPVYRDRAGFSNGGPNDYRAPGGIVIQGVRPAVDIAAPGTNMILAAYTGTTGTNTGGTDDFVPLPGEEDIRPGLYLFGAAGTSFAAPIVAGGASLLVDAGYATLGGGNSVDGRVIKAVLLNAAKKTPGWTNNAHTVAGVLTTEQGLDWGVGAGKLDLDRAYDQYLSGTHDLPGLGGGTVLALGWDYGRVALAAPIEYVLAGDVPAGQMITATLDWFVNRVLDDVTGEASDVQFDNLDLQLWLLAPGGGLGTLVADSVTDYNNVEHIYFLAPDVGQYALRVIYAGQNYGDPTQQATDYALAWSVTPPASNAVPEPALLAPAGVAVLLLRRRRR